MIRLLTTAEASYDDGGTCGDASDTWIGNDGARRCVLISARNSDEATAGEVPVRTAGGAVLRGERAWIHPGYAPE